MPQPAMLPYLNVLLRKCHPDDLGLLEMHLERVDLKAGGVIEHPFDPIQFAYFVEVGMLSVISKMERGRDVEMGVIGSEGMSGMALLLGDHQSPHLTNVQLAGYAYRISAEALTAAIRTSRRLHDFLLLHVRAFEIQIASTASASGRARFGDRLSRWLLMTQDRSRHDRIEITHDFLARMLACRRPSVTVALHELEGDGLIKASRAMIVIVDRKRLEENANGAYGLAEKEYERLIGVDFRK